MKERLALKTIFFFFLPLLFMMELIQISHSITNAFLARLLEPKVALAAFSLAFAFNFTASGVTMCVTQAGISFITDRTSCVRLFKFFALFAMIPFCILELTVLTPAGKTVFGQWMGASPDVVFQARKASAIMGLWIFPILIRNFAFAIVMNHRKTILITYATVIRLVSLVVSLILYSKWFNGADVGALATLTGMTVESVYMVIVARPFFKGLDKDTDMPPSYGEFWRFSWPLVITQIIENSVMFVLNFFLGNLMNPDLAIASFGVTYGLVRLLLGPLRNLIQTTQTLVKKRTDLKAIFQFTFGLILFYIFLNYSMFYTPMNEWILNGLMGLSLELSRYITPAVRIIFTIAIFWAATSLLRGVLSAMRQTRIIAVTAGLRLAVMAGIGSVSLFCKDFNGAVLGIIAFAGSFVVETMVLGWYLYGQVRLPGSIFPNNSDNARHPV